MTLERLIVSMAHKGFDLDCGPHGGVISGYYAEFYKDGHALDLWNKSGHAKSLPAAIRMAAKLVLGQKVTVPPTSKFDK
jgi:hypothetical protein